MTIDQRHEPAPAPGTRGGAAPAWWLLGFGLAATAIFLAVPRSTTANATYEVGGGLVIAGAWVAVVRRREAMGCVGLLLAGVTAWLLGDSLWWGLELAGHPVGFPSFVDVVYFAGYPLIVGGLVVMWRQLLASVLGGLLDGAALAAAGGLLLWAVAVAPSGAVHETVLQSLLAVGYPTLDLFVLIGLCQLALTAEVRRVRALQALIAGMSLYLVSDCFYAYSSMRGTYVESTWRDVGWLLMYVLVAFAVAHPSGRKLVTAREHRLPAHPTRMVVLAVGSLTAPVAMFVAIRRGTFEPAAFAFMTIVILLMVFRRMAVIFSDYRFAEADAQEGREFYRALVENGPDLVMLMALDGELLFASPSFERILGYAPGDVLGTSMLALTDPADLPLAHANLSAAYVGDAIPPFTIRAHDVHGAVVWLEVTATAIDTKGGPAILSQARDVTRSRLMESSLAETSSTLRHSSPRRRRRSSSSTSRRASPSGARAPCGFSGGRPRKWSAGLPRSGPQPTSAPARTQSTSPGPCSRRARGSARAERASRSCSPRLRCAPLTGRPRP